MISASLFVINCRDMDFFGIHSFISFNICFSSSIALALSRNMSVDAKPTAKDSADISNSYSDHFSSQIRNSVNINALLHGKIFLSERQSRKLVA